MDAVAFVGLVASIIQIADAFQKTGMTLSPQNVLAAFKDRQNVPGSPESRLKIQDSEVIKAAGQFIFIQKTNQAYIDRIKERCLKKYQEAITDYDLDEVDLHEIRNVARICVCQNIKMMTDDNGGVFPNEEVRAWFKQFGCGF